MFGDEQGGKKELGMSSDFFPGKRRHLLLLFCAISSVLACANAQNSESPKRDSPLGDWRGMSVCQVKPSGCQDEDSLYHFKKLASKPGAFELQADKIVDGKPVTMGTGPCEYDASGSLVCTIPGSPATLAFEVRGDDMQGTMKMADGTVWRKLTLKKVKER